MKAKQLQAEANKQALAGQVEQFKSRALSEGRNPTAELLKLKRDFDTEQKKK